jgi:hypothetical protein
MGVVFVLVACSGGSNPQVSPGSRGTATPAGVPTNAPTNAPTTAPTSAGTFTPDDWPLSDHDAARSGTSNETPGGQGAVTLNKLWQVSLGDIADSSPIVKGSMLYVTVHNGTTYGIATSNGATVWTFTTTGPNITTSEPAYDESGNEVYAGGVDGKIHRLNPATGAEDTSGGFPVTIILATQTEKDASPLNVANGYVYAQTSGYDGDGDPYVGHVAAIDIATGQLNVFNTLCSSQSGVIQPSTCSQNRSGMWSRAGVVVDPDSSMNGQIYVATGNGEYDPANGDYGDSDLALARDASALSAHFTPSNAAQLDADDTDLGSSSPVVLPRQSGSNTPLLAVQAGKDGILRLLDRTNLSGANAVLQSITMSQGLYSAPAVYVNPSGQTFIYVGLGSGVNAYRVTTSGGATSLVPAWTTSVSMGYAGTSPSVRDGVVYVAASNELVALDASTGATLGSNSALGTVHWEAPAIANGTIYCADENGNLTAFAIVRSGDTSAKKRQQPLHAAGTSHGPLVSAPAFLR